MLGHPNFDLGWVSVYKFQCRRMKRFVHGRVIFAGDSAHQVSPFGARGCNSGLEDAENLAWKIAMVLRGEAPESLLESYDVERGFAADENILASTRSTDFIAPHSRQELRLRSAVLRLASETEFAKRMVNSGRLSVPAVYETPLSTGDAEVWAAGPRPGAHMVDAPVSRSDGTPIYLTDAFKSAGGGFVLFESVDGAALDAPAGVGHLRIGKDAPLRDQSGVFARRYDASPGSAYLLRPDGYVAARFKRPTRPAIEAALQRASGRD